VGYADMNMGGMWKGLNRLFHKPVLFQVIDPGSSEEIMPEMIKRSKGIIRARRGGPQ
jgi:hypothetical protein